MLKNSEWRQVCKLCALHAALHTPALELAMCRAVETKLQLEARNEGQNSLEKAVRRLAVTVKDCPVYVSSVHRFKKLHGCGAALAGIVEDNLWSKYPPDPAPGDDAEWASFLESFVRSSHRQIRLRA